MPHDISLTIATCTANADVQGQQTSPQLHHHHVSRFDTQAGSYPVALICAVYEVAMYVNITVKVKYWYYIATYTPCIYMHPYKHTGN